MNFELEADYKIVSKRS